ncbi:MAG: hypothetical protein A3J74_09020 [Elusimicrobia bacterium RIFCSPHIGHO2_02_FULL_57_9]|nr:MAG: hypothetical protein A3J74_09020 [Elusimicrobia bacterium RIFCSPHIGHO2_02_FULL_57_9]
MTADIKEHVRVLGLAKASVDNGFSRVGKTLDASDPVQSVLMLLASRAVAISNALVLLAMHHHANEALPILRSLMGIAAQMLWIVESKSPERAHEFMKGRKNDWEMPWQKLDQGISWRDHVYANAGGLPWGHVFSENSGKGISSEDLLKTAAAVMEQALKALERRWPGKFEQTRGNNI